MISRRAPWGLALAIALLPALLAGPAGAEPTREDRAAALALFDEGRKLAADKKYAEACPKFEASMRLDPGMGTLFNLSDCYEQIGRTASAWAGFRDVAGQAKAQNQEAREKLARERAAALEGKLAKVRVVVPPELASAAFTITRDGVAFPASLVGTPIPLDPGPHTIRVTADGKEPWETKITLKPEGGTVDVQVPVLAPQAGGPATAGTGPAPTGSGTAPSPSGTASAGPVVTAPPPPSGTPDSASPRPWQMPLGVAATAVGAVGLGVGVAFGFVAKGTFDDSNKKGCIEGTGFCTTEEGVSLRHQAVEQGNIGTIIGVAGSVIGAAGIVVWILAPSSPKKAEPPAKSGSVTNVRVGAAPGGMVVTGQF